MYRLALAILLTIGVCASYAQDFAGVRFGMTREQAIESLLSAGYDAMGQGSSDRIVIPVYQYGDLPVEVAYLFNKAGKVHSIEVRTGRVEGDRYDKVLQAVQYMSEQLARTYGQPVRKFSPEIGSIRGGFRSFFWEWSHSDLVIYTAVTSLDGRYFSVGNITSKSLSASP